jgi:cation diffusion facilitator family transporter
MMPSKEKNMSAHCCNHDPKEASKTAASPRYRRILWIALAINAAMFLVEIVAGLRSGSVSLLADAIDFFGDAANYGLTLAVLPLGLAWSSRAAILKALSMLAFGAFVAVSAAWALATGEPPHAATMGIVGTLALLANVGVAAMLYAYREGNANMRSVWLCSRNDALGNVAVLVAAAGVLGTGSAWPDLAVAMAMAALAIHSGWSVLKQARQELAWDAH